MTRHREKQPRMPSIVWMDLVAALLWALGCVRAAVYLARRYHGTVSASHWPPTITWLWRIGWLTGVVGAVAFGMLRIRYPRGARLVIPASAPPLDHVVQVLGILCSIGCIVVLVVWKVALSRHERRVRRQRAGRPWPAPIRR